MVQEVLRYQSNLQSSNYKVLPYKTPFFMAKYADHTGHGQRDCSTLEEEAGDGVHGNTRNPLFLFFWSSNHCHYTPKPHTRTHVYRHARQFSPLSIYPPQVCQFHPSISQVKLVTHAPPCLLPSWFSNLTVGHDKMN